jgi:carboxyl-terminal processing protease
MLQGREGSVVEVTVETPGYTPRTLRVRRENVEIPSVDEVKMVDRAAKIGYLKLTCFQKTTPRDLDAALWQLHREGMQSLVIDLRGNPGGLLSTSVEVADKFVGEGLIVSTRGRSVSEDLRYSGHQAGTWQVPLVVLIDGDSASASEIFAGAIQDHRRGTIIGTRSYGKGSVQGIFPLTRGGAGLRLTTAKFYSPQNRPYSGVGVAPDVEVRYTARPTDEGALPLESASDPVIDQAVRTARLQMVQRQ